MMKKKTLRRVNKGLNAFVAILLLVQPVGTPGILGAIALAEEATVQSADAQAPAPETKADPAPEETAPAPDPTPTDPAPVSDNTPSAPAISDPSPASDPVSDTGSTAPSIETPADTTPVDTPPADNATSVDSSLNTDNTDNSATTGTISPDAASTEAPAVEASGKVCLEQGANIVSSENSDWNVSGDTAETKNKVELGVKYVFPGNDKVSVTFTCLPADSADRTTLKIQQINAADINLPEGIAPASEFAYDITTGMKDGDFEYDLTLPKADVDGAEVNYIEKTAGEVTKQDLSKSDLKAVDGEKVKEGDDSVKVEELDHFTVWVTTISAIASVIPVFSDCINDTNGANDEPGQKDLTQLCRDLSSVDPLEITWNWDEIQMTGSNTADACSLFDTDNDGLANYSMCVTWEKNQQQISGSPRLYSCADTRADRCAGASNISISGSSQCVVEPSIDDPFPSGDEYPNDTKAYCQIDLDDVGGASKASLLDVCSYPSEQPNSDPSDCVVIKENKGILEIFKDVVPDNQNTNWVITGSGPTNFSDTLTGDDNTGIISVDLGTYSIVETAGTNTNLNNYSTTWNCIKNGDSYLSGSGTTISGVVVGKSGNTMDSVVCTITNTQKSNIIVKKETSPTGSQQNFEFDPSWSSSNFFLKDGEQSDSGYLDAGNYSVSEVNIPSGWGLTSATCDDGSNPSSIELSNGETVTCTFSNVSKPSLTVKKLVITDNGGTAIPSNFTLHVKSGGNDISGSPFGGSVSGESFVLDPGNYMVSEDNFAGYTGTIGDDCLADGSVSLAYGENKTCTITNDDQPATLIVKKVVVNDNGGTKTAENFSFSVNGGVATSFETDGQNDLSVAAGTYNVTEPAVTGYATTYDNCSNIVIPNGGTATCTITNNDIAPKLKLVKTVINNNGGNATASNFQAYINGNAVSWDVFNTLDAGNHTASESNLSGYTASAWGGDCAIDGTITLAPGDEKTCTITNDDQPGTLIVKKVIVNDDGGNKTCPDFSFSYNSSGNIAFQADCQNDITVPAGTYSVTEPAVTGYATTYDNCTDVVIPNGGSATCTITNDDIAPKLTLVKHVTNNNGGNAVVADFPLFIDGTPAISGTAYEVAANATHTATETNLPGYSPSSWGGDCAADGTVILLPGEEKTCDITNDDVSASITLIKNVINNNGGNAGVNDFGLTIGGIPVTSGQKLNVNANTPYALNEAGLAGYDFISMTGDTKCPSVLGGEATLDEGEDITCTITNDDQSPTITLIKNVIKDNGGTAGVNDFGLTIGAAAVDSGQTLNVLANTSYALNEAGLFGYDFVDITGDAKCPSVLGGTVSLDEGEDITCTITNDDIQPKLTVYKIVDNGDGGNLFPSNFAISVNGTNANPNSFPGDDNGTLVALDAGDYEVTETEIDGYDADYSDDCDGSIAVGETKTCTITNDDEAPTLTLVKTVKNDNGGNKEVSDFKLYISGNPAVSGVPVTLQANTQYTASEDQLQGYSASAWGGDCDPAGNITLAPGQDAICTITNDDVAPKLTLVKHVTNNNGGTAVVSDFPLFIDGVSAISGTTYEVTANALHTATETNQPGYTPSSWSGDCAADGTITLLPGDNKTCEITNDDQTGRLIVRKIVINDNNGGKTASNFSFSVNGGGLQAFEADGQNEMTVNSGYYSITEPAVTGYATSYDNCSSVFVPNGGSATCTITNNDIQPKLKVIKHVINDNNGTAVASDFTISIAGNGPNPWQFQGSETGTDISIDAGDYVVDEASNSGYTKTLSADCVGKLLPGDDKTCTITNNDIQPKLTVTKVVLNDGYGTLGISNFPLFVNATSVGSGVQNNFNVGDYVVSETNQPGYAATISGDCDGSGNVTLNPGDVKACTITNDDEFGKIIVEKQTIPDGDGASFSFKGDVSGSVSDGGQLSAIVVPGAYSSSEMPLEGWDLTDIKCDDSDSSGDVASGTATFNVDPSETVTCTFTNTKRGKIIVDKVTDPSGDLQSFQIGVYDNQGLIDFFSLTDADTPYESGWLLPGSGYDVIEQFGNLDGWWDFDYSSQCVGSSDGRTMSYQDFELRAGETVTCTIKNIKKGSISGVKWEDTNGDGTKDAGEPQLNGWTIFIDDNDDGILDPGERSTTTADIGNGPGEYLFDRVSPNTYSVCEVEQSDWQRTYPVAKNCQDVTVKPGAVSENTNFGNFKLGEITVCKYNDYTGNGNYDSQDDQPLGGISIKLSKNISANWVLEDTKETAASDGCTTFSGLFAGQYRVEEDYTDPDLAGYYSTNGIVHHDVNIVSGSEENKIFLNALYRTISGTKFNDLNGNGVKDAGEPGLENWTIFIDYNNNGILDGGEPSTTTDANGDYEFANLVSDLYIIVEVLEPGWTQTAPATGHYDVDVHTAITSTGNDFGNVQLTDIHGYKWNDLNGNGIQEGEETKLSGWEIFIDKNDNSIWDDGEPKTATSSDPDPQHFGWYWFEDLLPGQYKVCEVQQPGWTQTSPTPQCHTMNLPDDCTEFSEDSLVARIETLNFVQTFCEFDFGNQFVEPILQIQKSNNKFPVDQAPGSDVVYTLTVTALENDVNGVIVTDLPPAGFTYRPGSWTASSSVRGDIKNNPTTEPTYASPGNWNLGDMKQNEVVTLSYTADISTGQESGSYPDLAWTEGQSLKGDDVLGEGTSSHFVQDAFVGTEVAVVRTGEVKGASVKIDTDRDTDHKKRKIVVLPATGFSPWWIAVAILLLLAGAGFMYAGKRKKKDDNPNESNDMSNMAKLLVAGLIGLSALFAANSTQAATTLAAQMETPKSPYQTADFDLGFVALDINGDPVTVKCFVGGAEFQTINLAGGGTSGNCGVNSSVIPGSGTYQFHISATSGSETVTTPDVPVEVILGGPGTPTHYDRSKISNCEYKITFDTASDGGKTTRVELYRSTERSYTADAGTKVDELAIGSNQPGSFTATKPDCSETYYFVVRAFDALGNGSGVVGDTRTVTVTTGGGTTTITAPGGGAIPTGGATAGAATGGATAGGAVAGEQTPAEEQTGSAAGEEGQVLGEQTGAEEPQSFFQKHPYYTALGILIILAIIYYAATRKKKTNFPKEPPQSPAGPAPEA